MGYVAEHHDKLRETLRDKQKEILEKFDNCYNERIRINERELLAYAFKLGVRLAIEVHFPAQGD